MSDISASERRLSAALDRIDQILERESRKTAPSWPDTGLQAALESAKGENQRLKAQLAAVVSSSGEKAKDGVHLPDAIARLVAANAGLTAANRALIESASGKSDAVAAVRLAFEQEIESFHTTRAAETAQLEGVMAELTRLLNNPEAAPPEQHHNEGQPAFSGVYGDTPEDEDESAGKDK